MGARTAVAVVIAIWAGMLCGLPCADRPAAWTAIAALALLHACGAAALGSRLRGPGAQRALGRVADVALLAALATAGCARLAAHEAVLVHQRRAFGDGLHRVTARIVDPPLRESGTPSATAVVLASRPALVQGTRLRLSLPAGSDAEWGDVISAWVRLEAPGAPRNPGGIDPRQSATAGALAGWGRALTTTVVDSAGWPRATAARWRRAIERVYAVRLTPAAREIVTPLVTGDRSALDSELDAAFRAAGVVHLLALSGLHVTWMAGVARGLVAAAGGGVAARAVAGACCAVFYAVLAGPLPSLARAVATELVAAGAVAARRPLDPVQALAASAVLGLVIAPGWAWDLGFQLSCAATLGLLTVGAALADRAGRWRRALEPVLPTASAQLTALPLLVARMHSVSWISPLVNLLAVPVSGLLLAGAWLGVVWELAVPGTARWVFAACEALETALRCVTEWGARLPGAARATGSDPAVPIAAACGAVLIMAALLPRRVRRAPGSDREPWRAASAAAGIAFEVAALACAGSGGPCLPPGDHAWLVTLDVGQGTAIGVATRDGWWLVDAGPRSPHTDAGERFVLPFLRWAGVRELNGLVLSHDDSDHTGGAAAVLRGMRVRARWAPPPRADAPGPGPRFHAAALARGDSLAPGLRVLWPPAAVRQARGWSDNHAAVVLVLACDTTRALLLADVDSTAEALLDAPRAAVIEVAHHGSRSSTGTALLAAARPRWALVSCGRWNHFGHPHPEVLARLAAVQAIVRRTDRDGAIWLELGPDGVRELDWRGHADALRLGAAAVPIPRPRARE